jgi:hypothetical protein
MMEWVLILWISIYTPGSGAGMGVVQGFNSLAECVSFAEKALESVPEPEFGIAVRKERSKFTCLPKRKLK